MSKGMRDVINYFISIVLFLVIMRVIFGTDVGEISLILPTIVASTVSILLALDRK